MTGNLYLQHEQEKTYSEIKTLIFDNLVPLSEQKNKEVANNFRMTQQQYSRFENGVFELNYTQIYEICKRCL